MQAIKYNHALIVKTIIMLLKIFIVFAKEPIQPKFQILIENLSKNKRQVETA